jgi:hypothetical protein
VCCICTKLIAINKEPKYLVFHNISSNSIINSISNLCELEERLIAPRQAFAQIWQVEGYGQFKTQSILPCMPNDEATTSFILNCKLKYKSPY